MPTSEEAVRLVVLKPKMTYPHLTPCKRDLILYFYMYEINLI